MRYLIQESFYKAISEAFFFSKRRAPITYILACIEPNPTERVTVQQLLENDFFEEKYLNVLVVGKNINELKLRLGLILIQNLLKFAQV